MNEKQYSSLIQSLKKKGIPLESFEEFLALRKQKKIKKLDSFLKQQEIDRQQFKDYLEQECANAQTTLVQKSTTEKTNKTTQWAPIKEIGFYLLSQYKIEIAALNQILQEIPENAPKFLLQQLLKERKITIEEFLQYLQSDFSAPSLSSLPYQARIEKGKLAYHFHPSKETKTFGPYQVLEELGSGGMGIVYKVFHPQLNQTYALKILRQEAFSSEQLKQRFLREIQTMIKLNHPGITQITDTGITKNQHYFVMEFIDGESLKQKMREGISIRKAVSLMQKVLTALSYAHQQGVIHRDLKPENIFISLSGEPKIGDFGLAKDLNLTNESQKLTQSGTVLGTVKYMSPEQAAGNTSQIDKRTDLYSIGVCLYQILTQRIPYSGSSTQQLLEKIIHEDPVPPSKLNPRVHPDLENIVLKALAKEPTKRYQTAKTFEKDLARFLAGNPLTIKPLTQREKWSRWRKKNHHLFLLTLVAGFFCFALLVSYFGIRYYQQNQLFSLSFQKALAAKNKVTSDKNPEFLSQDEKIHHLLNALNHINQTLLIRKSDLRAEQIKLEIGRKLIQLACKQQSYQFAKYLAKELASLHILNKPQKAQINQEVLSIENSTAEQHKKRFDYWCQQLKSNLKPKRFHDDAIFEISKMTEKQILQNLLKIQQEGLQYFLNQQPGNQIQEEYYKTMTMALGLLSQETAAMPLWHSLKKMQQKINQPQAPSLSDTDYMVCLAKALSQIKTIPFAQEFIKLRFSMGQNSLFWRQTYSVQRKLVSSGKLAKKEALNAFEFDQRGFSKLSQGDIEGAILDYTEAIQLDPKNSGFYNNRGNAKFQKKDLDGAIEDYTQAILFGLQIPEVYINRGNAKFEKTLYATAILDFNQAIRINSKNALAYSSRGRAHKGLKNYQQAIQDQTLALKLNPQLSSAYYYRANAKRDQKNFRGALEDYSNAIRLAPNDALSYSNRGNTKTELQDYHGAILDISKAIRLKPSYPRAYFYRGDAKLLQGDIQGSIQDYNQAIQLDPLMTEAYINRGNANYQQKKLKAAIVDFNRAIDLKTTNIHLAYNNRGLIHLELGELKKAMTDFEKAINAAPNYSEAYYNRGNLKTEFKDWQGAINDFSRVIQLDPNKIYGYFNRGVAQLRKRNLIAAKKDFSVFIQKTKKNQSSRVKKTQQQIYKIFPELKKKTLK